MAAPFVWTRLPSVAPGVVVVVVAGSAVVAVEGKLQPLQISTWNRS